jgi:phage FluMu protein Com
MKTLDLNPELQTEDKAGNNIALTCPECGKVYIVSEFIHGGERSCPKCKKSKGFVKGDKARIHWDFPP